MLWLTKHYLWMIAFAIIFSGVGLLNFSKRPALPFGFKDLEQKLIITEKIPLKERSIPIGAVIETIDGKRVRDHLILEEIIELKKIGSPVSIQLSNKKIFTTELISKNSFLFLLVNGIIALSFLIISARVWRESKSEADRTFSFSAILFGIIIATGWAGIGLPEIISLPLCIIYFLCYPQAFLFLLFFGFQFPQISISPKNLKRVKIVLQVIGTLFSIIFIVLFFIKYQEFNDENIYNFYLTYRYFRIFIFFTFILFLAIVLRNFLRAPNPVNRNKIQWIIFGIFWGSFPFIFLWNLPQIFGYSPFVPEWFFVIFLLLIPLSITIAILRYRLFDIEIVLSRSLIYTAVIITLLTIYLLVVGGISFLMYQQFLWRSPLISIIAALIIALVFNPIKIRIQLVVNRKFFHIRYHRFRSLQLFREDLEKCSGVQEIVTQLNQHFQAAVPLEKTKFLSWINGEWAVFPSIKPADKRLTEKLQSLNLVSYADFIINAQMQNKVEIYTSFTTFNIPGTWVLLIPMGKSFLWLLSEKKAGTKFWKEDVELALEMSKAARDKRDTIINMQAALRANLEKEHAQQLSEWKTLLISEVAHDLQSPLNTMLWKLHNIQLTLSSSLDLPGDSLSDIKQQIFRLQRLIQSLLIMAKSEKSKIYPQLQSLSIRDEIEEVIDNLQGIISQKQLKINFDCPAKFKIKADPILFQEIMLNILQNSTKFSEMGKQIWVNALEVQRYQKQKILISIKDQAGGIDKDKLKTIFQPFYQNKKEQVSEKGFHLGMYIVNEFTKYLKGEIVVKSKVKVGTTFNLYFPVI